MNDKAVCREAIGFTNWPSNTIFHLGVKNTDLFWGVLQEGEKLHKKAKSWIFRSWPWGRGGGGWAQHENGGGVDDENEDEYEDDNDIEDEN